MQSDPATNNLAARVIAFRDGEVRRFVDSCAACGECILVCPTVALTAAGNHDASDVQQMLRDFLAGEGVANEAVHARAFSCLECAACIADVCPEELDPMAANQAVMAQWPEPPPEASPRAKAGSIPRAAPTVLFAGCNIYRQPDLVSDMAGIMDRVADGAWALLPGGELCCGNDRLAVGDIPGMAAKLERLVDALDELKPQTVLLWCTACTFVFHTLVAPTTGLPFRIQSFTRYVADRVQHLAWNGRVEETVTIHEPCRSGHLDFDGTAAGDILAAIPGLRVVDMPRHGKTAACCGNNALKRGFAAGTTLRNSRYAEARSTGATTLATVCHRCQEVLSEAATDGGPGVRHFLSIVSEVLG